MFNRLLLADSQRFTAIIGAMMPIIGLLAEASPIAYFAIIVGTAPQIVGAVAVGHVIGFPGKNSDAIWATVLHVAVGNHVRKGSDNLDKLEIRLIKPASARRSRSSRR